MKDTVSIDTIYREFKQSLELKWLHEPQQTAYVRAHPEDITQLVGYFNFVHPQLVSVLGQQEFNYLGRLPPDAYLSNLESVYKSHPAVIIIADGEFPSHEMLDLAQHYNTPLLQSSKNADIVIENLSHFLTHKLAPRLSVHGVFLEVFDLGVLLTGPAGIGKSELALELISRNHRLIADDAPLFYRLSPGVLTGKCPQGLQDFLEVRGLGVINIRALFGDTSVKDQKHLHLIIRIIQSDPDPDPMSRLQGVRHHREFLNIQVPEISLVALPGRSLSILVETAVRNQVLKRSGYDAFEAFSKHQQLMIEQQIL